jgi:hypothetical protein
VCGYSWVATPLGHGYLPAFLSGLTMCHGAMSLLARLLERRWLRPLDMALGFTVGDLFLCIALSLGVSLFGLHSPCGVVGPVGQYLVSAAWLCFGIWQSKHEVTANFYTRAQELSPTKIWHQCVIYPVLGTWIYVAVLDGLLHASRNPLVAALMCLCVIVWGAACAYDSRHPRLDHIPFDWSKFRPQPKPWSKDSVTLRASSGIEL